MESPSVNQQKSKLSDLKMMHERKRPSIPLGVSLRLRHDTLTKYCVNVLQNSLCLSASGGSRPYYDMVWERQGVELGLLNMRSLSRPKTLLLSFENDPAGVNVSIEW